MTHKDIYIKDEGNFVTVIAMTPEAKIIFDKHGVKNQYPQGYKFDCNLSDLHLILGFAITHDLSVDSEVSINVPKKVSTIYDLRIKSADNSEDPLQIVGSLESIKPNLPPGFYEVLKQNIDGFNSEYFQLSMTSSQTLKTYTITTCN